MLHRSALWSDPRLKPPYGEVGIDWTHPLAQHLYLAWLLNDAGGNTANDLAGSQGGTLGGSPLPTWGAGPDGVGLTTNSNYVVNKTVLNTAHVTMAVALRPAALANGQIASFKNGSGSGTFEKTLQVGTGKYTWYVVAGSVVDSVAITPNVRSVLVGTADGVTSRAYKNGIEFGNLLSGDTYQSYTVPNVFLGDSAFVQTIEWFMVWTQALSAGLVSWLSAEPYAFCQPIVRRRYFVPATVAGGVTYPQLERFGSRGVERGILTGVR